MNALTAGCGQRVCFCCCRPTCQLVGIKTCRQNPAAVPLLARLARTDLGAGGREGVPPRTRPALTVRHLRAECTDKTLQAVPGVTFPPGVDRPGGRRPRGCSTRNQASTDCGDDAWRPYGDTMAAMYGSAPPSSSSLQVVKGEAIEHNFSL